MSMSVTTTLRVQRAASSLPGTNQQAFIITCTEHVLRTRHSSELVDITDFTLKASPPTCEEAVVYPPISEKEQLRRRRG